MQLIKAGMWSGVLNVPDLVQCEVTVITGKATWWSVSALGSVADVRLRL